MNEKSELTMTNWVRHTSFLFELEAGGLTLIVEDRSARQLGWCWNVKILGCFGGSEDPGGDDLVGRRRRPPRPR